MPIASAAQLVLTNRDQSAANVRMDDVVNDDNGDDRNPPYPDEVGILRNDRSTIPWRNLTAETGCSPYPIDVENDDSDYLGKAKGHNSQVISL